MKASRLPSARGFGSVAGLLQCPLVEGVAVDDDRCARLQVADVGLQRGRVHGHQHVRVVARGEDVVVRDVDLERRDAGQGARRRPDFGREVRQRRQVVAEDGRTGRETVAGQLHTVAGVPGEADDDPVEDGELASLCSCISQIDAPWYQSSQGGLRSKRSHPIGPQGRDQRQCRSAKHDRVPPPGE